jgi:hypothetical protein
VATVDQDFRQHCRFQINLRVRDAREAWQKPIGSASFQIVDCAELQSAYLEASYCPEEHIIRITANGQQENTFSINLSQKDQNQSQASVERIK